jgi:Uma2 family endonuclease
MSTATLPDRQYLLLHDVSWDDFRHFERMVDDRHGCRLTFDRGKLEFRELSFGHERVRMLIHRLFAELADAFDVPRCSAGCTTLHRQDLNRAFEPDQSYYLLENEPLIRCKDEIDLAVDPPPDLVIEVEVVPSAVDRVGVLAALGVPEVWPTDGESLRFLRLSKSGGYDEVVESLLFPGISADGIAPFLRKQYELEERKLVKSFRGWVREVGRPSKAVRL